MEGFPTDEERRAFVDALEENLSRVNTLTEEEFLGFMARMMDLSGILPSTLTTETHTKIAGAGLGLRETAFALGMLFAISMPENFMEGLLDEVGFETVKAEVNRYINYFSK